MHEEVSLAKKRPTPVDGTLRKFALRVPECIYKASGILVFGKRIKSLVYDVGLTEKLNKYSKTLSGGQVRVYE